MKKLLLLAMCMLLYGCGGNKAEETMQTDVSSIEQQEEEFEDIEEEEEEEQEEEEVEPEEDLTGKAMNPLSGLYIDEEVAMRRPIAVVINNLRRALPQSGIGQADLYYEVLAEGNVTRIIAVFQDFDSEKIGPIRSTRHYFLNFALDHDAIFTHHGGSSLGLQFIRNNGINNLDGMVLDGTAVWRDPDRVRQSGMFEHSAYTSAANLLQAAEERFNYRMERNEFEPMFEFFDEFTSLDGEVAEHITIPFANSQTSIFEYDPDSMLYNKYQNDDMHIDEETGEQLTVTNVIVQQVPHSLIPNDPEGRREVALVGNGTGYLFSGGEYINVNWSKASHNQPTVWTHEDGTILTLNKGKTWINVIVQSIEPIIDPHLEVDEEEEE